MELRELLKNLAKEFESNEISYMIIGGQAVLIYGEPRLTKDIDITIGAGLEKFNIIMNIAKKLSLKVLPENPYEFTKTTMVLPLMDEKTGLRVDIIFSYSPYEKEALKRVKRINIDGVNVNYVSVEDLIIHKIVSGREMDFEDVRKIMIKNKNIDEEYILKHLKEFERALDNAELIKNFLKIKERIKK